MRRRLLQNQASENNAALFQMKSGTSIDGSVVTISNENHVYAMSNSTSGPHSIWLNPSCDGFTTSISKLGANGTGWPTDTLLSLSAGDVVKFIITNNDTAITNNWQSLYVGFAVGKKESVRSGQFQKLTELTTEVIIEEDMDVTALFVHINRLETEAEFDLVVYVNDMRCI